MDGMLWSCLHQEAYRVSILSMTVQETSASVKGMFGLQMSSSSHNIKKEKWEKKEKRCDGKDSQEIDISVRRSFISISQTSSFGGRWQRFFSSFLVIQICKWTQMKEEKRWVRRMSETTRDYLSCAYVKRVSSKTSRHRGISPSHPHIETYFLGRMKGSSLRKRGKNSSWGSQWKRKQQTKRRHWETRQYDETRPYTQYIVPRLPSLSS